MKRIIIAIVSVFILGCLEHQEPLTDNQKDLLVLADEYFQGPLTEKQQHTLNKICTHKQVEKFQIDFVTKLFGLDDFPSVMTGDEPDPSALHKQNTDKLLQDSIIQKSGEYGWTYKDTVKVDYLNQMFKVYSNLGMPVPVAIQEAIPQNLTSEKIQMSLVDIKWDFSDYKDYIKVKLTIQNKYDKTIVGLKGKVVLCDIFGDVVWKYNFSHDDNIKPNTTIKRSSYFDYNQFMQSHIKFSNTNWKKITLKWQPTLIIFKDGSKLEQEE